MFRRDERAVSGVVAASLSVVLLSVLLGMVVTFWVPAWGYDNELAHSRATVNSFGQFKNSVELLALSSDTNQTVTTTFTLGVGAVPLFGAETPGSLSFQYLEGSKVRFRANLTDGLGQVNLSAAGSLEYAITNRYFVPQTIAYESGAVVVDQKDVSVSRLPAALRLVNGPGGLEVALSLVSLEGSPRTVAGVDPHVVSARLTVAYTQSYTWLPLNNLSLNITTGFDEAWAGFFIDTANSSGISASLYNVSTGTETATLRLQGVRTLSVTVALVSVRLE